MKNKKLAMILSIVLVAALAVGGTLAWLTQNTNVENNKFTLVQMESPNPDMDAKIIETFDPNDAKDLVPSKVVTKIVTLKNTSPKEISEWAAIKLTFQKGDQSTPAVMTDLLRVMQIQSIAGNPDFFDSSKWVRKNTGDLQQQEIFYYKTKLVKDEVTASLFDSVKIKEEADNADMNLMKSWGGFNIHISGAVVQGDMSDTLVQAVKDKLDSLLA